jgi:hypothetical protein
MPLKTYETKLREVARRDIVALVGVLGIVLIITSVTDLSELILRFAREHEYLQLDEIFLLSTVAAIGAAIFAWRRLGELHQAVLQTKILQGLLPICASCKKIRDDHGYWSQLEKYLSEHSDVTFTHGICPDCAARAYAELEQQFGNRGKKQG